MGYCHDNLKIAQETSAHVPRVLLHRRRVLESTLMKMGVSGGGGSVTGTRPGGIIVMDGGTVGSFI